MSPENKIKVAILSLGVIQGALDLISESLEGEDDSIKAVCDSAAEFCCSSIKQLKKEEAPNAEE